MDNKRQLLFQGEIDINKAINDLIALFQWEKNNHFTPTINIQLDDVFDPGGGSGGGSYDPNSAPTKFMNGLKYAQSGNIYWNLNYESACTSLTNYILSNIGILVKFTFSTTFYEETSPDYWELKYHTATYDGWTFIESDMATYVKINNIKIDGDSKNKFVSLSVDDLMLAVSQDGKTGFLGTMEKLGGIFAGIAGCFITGFISCKIAVAVGTGVSLTGLTTLCTCLAIFFGFLALWTLLIACILWLVWI